MNPSSYWRLFYLSEQRFYDFINDQHIFHCMDDCYPVYREGPGTLPRPPRFVRCCVRLPNPKAVETFHNLNADVIGNYTRALEASGQKKSRLPDRFPVFFDQEVQRVNVSVDKAFSSVRVRGQEWSLGLVAEQDPAIIEALENNKIRSYYSFIGENLYELLIKTADLFEFAGGEHIQYREKTGSQYKVRVTTANDQVIKTRYSMLVFTNECPVYEQIPRKTRNDKLPDEKIIEFPVGIKGDFYLIG